jgi:hypothetical protein
MLVPHNMSVRSKSTSGWDSSDERYHQHPIEALNDEITRLTYAIKSASGNAAEVKRLKKELQTAKKELAAERKKGGRRTRKQRKLGRLTRRGRRL